MVQKIQYVSDGIQMEFGFPFFIFSEYDVKVMVNSDVIEYGIYKVDHQIGKVGGVINFDVPPAKDVVVTIMRVINLERAVDYQPNRVIEADQLNSDFNFLLESMKDVAGYSLDAMESSVRYEEMKKWSKELLGQMHYIDDLINSRVGSGQMGLFYNLVNVLHNAIPTLIDDYGKITDSVDSEDDYGCFDPLM